MAELRFVPIDESFLLPLFDAFSKGAEMNPDERGDDDGEEGTMIMLMIITMIVRIIIFQY